MPELERQLQLLRARNADLRMRDDPLNPSHRERFSEMERRIQVLSVELGKVTVALKKALKLLSEAEPSATVYVDVQQRSMWKRGQKELLQDSISE